MQDHKSQRFLVAEDQLISDRKYNLLIGGVIAYGLFVNVLMVKYAAPLFVGMSPLPFLLIYMLLAFSGILIGVKSTRPAYSFLGYNMVVVPFGMVLCVGLQGVASGIILQAALLTALVTAAMLIAATLRPDIFGSARLGRILFVTLLANLFVMLLCFLFRIQTMATTWVCVVLFSLYIAYDWARAQQYPKTVDNAIDCAMDIYMDIINLFLDLVRILNKD